MRACAPSGRLQPTGFGDGVSVPVPLVHVHSTFTVFGLSGWIPGLWIFRSWFKLGYTRTRDERIAQHRHMVACRRVCTCQDICTTVGNTAQFSLRWTFFQHKWIGEHRGSHTITALGMWMDHLRFSPNL